MRHCGGKVEANHIFAGDFDIHRVTQRCRGNLLQGFVDRCKYISVPVLPDDTRAVKEGRSGKTACPCDKVGNPLSFIEYDVLSGEEHLSLERDESLRTESGTLAYGNDIVGHEHEILAFPDSQSVLHGEAERESEGVGRLGAGRIVHPPRHVYPGGRGAVEQAARTQDKVFDGRVLGIREHSGIIDESVYGQYSPVDDIVYS